jgi:integrase
MKKAPSQKREKFPLEVKLGSVSVTIYKGHTRGYQLFTIAWYEGRKRMRKTFSDVATAKAEAQQIAIRLESGHRTAAAMKNVDAEALALAQLDLQPFSIPVNIAVKEFVHAKKILDGSSLIEAARFYAERRPTIESEISARDAVEEFLIAKESDGVGRRYLQDARSRLRRFAAAFSMPLSRISSSIMEGWLRNIAAHPRTRNNFRQHIVTLFRWARDKGYLAREAQTEADRLPLAKDKGSDVRCFTPDALGLLLAAADDTLRPYLAIRAFAGVRDSEMRRLAWENIRFEQGVIEIRAGQAKTASRRLIPILPNLAQWLASCRDRQGRISYANAERIARRVAAANGVRWIHNGLRHGFGSHRLAVLKDAAQVAHELGNTERIVHRHYKELVTESQGKAWFAIMPKAPANIVSIKAA